MHKPFIRRHFNIFVTEGFSTLAFSSIVGAINSANRELGNVVYTWEAVSIQGGGVRSDTQAQIDTRRSDQGEPEGMRVGQSRMTVLLLGGCSVEDRQKLIAMIREGLARGTKVLSIGEATMLLAEAGLLAGRRCAVHWRNFGVAIEQFPNVHFTRAFFEIDGLFHSCAGELAAFDLMLRIVQADYGRDVSEKLGVHALHGTPRGEADRQKVPNYVKLERTGSPLLFVVDMMEENISEPVDMKTLIKKASISRRQVERLFERQMGMSPKRYYLKLRLDRAKDLLTHSSMPIVDVAIATGFVSASHFSKTFRTFFGVSPTESRRDDVPVLSSNVAYGHYSTNDNAERDWSLAQLGRSLAGYHPA